MLDIETLGTNETAPILSIGAVFFNPENGDLGAAFYKVVDLVSSAQNAIIDADTVKWWMKQSDETRSIFNQYESVSLLEGLSAFSTFISDSVDVKKVKVWGNSSTFDNVILRTNYNKLGLPTPWQFYNDRDVRTIIDLARTIKGIDARKEIPRDGVLHNALDDALYQARYVSLAYQALKSEV